MEGLDPLDAGAADATHSVVAACAEACDDVASAARDVADETSSVAAAASSVALEGQAVSVCPTQMSLAPPPGNPNVIGAAAPPFEEQVENINPLVQEGADLQSSSAGTKNQSPADIRRAIAKARMASPKKANETLSGGY